MFFKQAMKLFLAIVGEPLVLILAKPFGTRMTRRAPLYWPAAPFWVPMDPNTFELQTASTALCCPPKCSEKHQPIWQLCRTSFTNVVKSLYFNQVQNYQIWTRALVDRKLERISQVILSLCFYKFWLFCCRSLSFQRSEQLI